MKILVLAAFVAVLTSGQLSASDQSDQAQWPWQVGKFYRYEVLSSTLARLEEGPSSGNAFKARFLIRVPAPGRLLARLENPQHAQVHQELSKSRQLPEDLKYQPVQKMEQPFEITLEGGRVQSLNLPSSMSLPHENLLKGLIGALQLDLSTYRHVRSSQHNYNKDTQQGLFRKMETDVTGDCETLYSISPLSAEWRREVPMFADAEEPIEISKSKNYGHCHHRVAYHFGVPEGSVWTGTPHNPHDEQFIERSTTSRILISKQGPIYKAETTSTVHVHPHMYGKQKAEVLSRVRLTLTSFEQDNQEAWPKVEDGRQVHNLLYSLSSKQVTISDSTSGSSSSESQENTLNPEVDVEDVPNRARRSAPRKIVSINKVVVKRSNKASSSSSSSSSSESASVFVNDDIPANNEPAYAALYMSPQPRVDKKQNSMNAQKLVLDIAQQLQNPNNLPKADGLSKFNILVRIIASMSFDQLSQTSRSLEVAKSSDNKAKADMWMIYRDAVAQAGTLPAFQQIKAWIQSKKIQEEEAAQVIATLVNSLRYPTKDLMMQFFNLAMSEEVKQQAYLNSTALIAVTRFINMGQVNNDTAHNFYPTHMYGRLSRRHDQFVHEEVLPRLSQELKQAIQEGDSNKAQVYIKAIGNLGHRSIIEVFAPYLEGKIPTSTYLRREMVHNLQVLAHQKDKHARAVLFSILKNTAEPFEVRVAAVHNIFMAHPTSAMMMAVAQMTHNDPSIQVRASLKSAIWSAAELKSPRHLHVSRTAKAAKWMVTKEEFGEQYSSKILDEYNRHQNEMRIMDAFSSIGSEDSMLPKFLRYSLKGQVRGYNRENTLSASFSSVQQFAQYFQYVMSHMQRERRQEPQQESNHKYSAEKISEMLNIKRDHQKPLEAAFYIDFFNQQRFFPVSEYDLQELPKAIAQYMSNAQKGIERHYTKIFNQAQVSIMFPVATGMPFIYKYKEPAIVHIQGKLKGHFKNPNQENKHHSASMDKEMYFTYARNLDGSVGFMDTLSNQYPCVGVVNKIQINVPLKLHLDMNSGELKVNLEPLKPDQDYNLLHYSVWPFSANQKRDSLVTVSHDPSTKVINRQYKTSSIDTKFGQSVGTLFHWQGYSYSEDYKNLGNVLYTPRFLFNIAAAVFQRDVAMTHYNLKYLGKQSQNKRVTLTAVYDTYYNLKRNAQRDLVASEVKDMSPNSDDRRQELINRVASGINTAKVQVIDLSASFEGPQQSEYVLTYAMANSPVDPKIQYAFHAGRNSPQFGKSQVNGVGTVIKSDISYLNFVDALNKEMKTTFDADIKYGQNGNGNIRVQGFTERTKKYAELLQNHPLAKECKEQIAQNSFYQEACYKMILLAHAPDHIKASVNYKEVSPAVKALVHQMYRLLEHVSFWRSENNPTKVTPDGKLDIAAEMSYLDNTMDLNVNSRLGELRISDVPIADVTPIALAIYRPFNYNERVLNYKTNNQYLPFCSVEQNRIKSFSNRAYDYTLSKSWHLVMQDLPSKPQDSNDKIVILARKHNEKQQEIYISYKARNGMNFEAEIQPAPEGSAQHTVKVNTNSKKVSEGALTIYWDEIEETPLFQFYTSPEGVLVLEIKENRLRALYDGQRLVILTKETRGNTRGICGYMSGSPRYDYLTPHGLVDKPEHYAASYALKENADPKTQELQVQAQQVAYQPKIQYTAILNSDNEWSVAMHSSSSSSSSEENSRASEVYRARNYLKQRGPCQVHEQVQYYEDHGEICITTTPVPSCQSHCRAEAHKVQDAKVTCRPKLDQQFIGHKEEIRRGGNPQVSANGKSKHVQYKVPTSCKA